MKITGDAKICAAFVKARMEIGGTVAKDAKGNFGRYATLSAITDATAEPLAKNGLAVIQESKLCDEGVTIYTWMIHESGATIEFAPITLPLEKRTPQGVGSAITYGRRYQLAAICGLAPDDDDGTEAEKNAGKRPPMPQTQRPPVQPPTRPAAPKQDAPPADFTLADVPAIDFSDAPPTPTDEFLAIPAMPEGKAPGKLATPILRKLHAVGSKLYGEEWDAKRYELVQSITKGQAQSSSDLTEAQANKLIAGMESKLQAAA